MRMEACQTYQLTVTNALEGANPGGKWNTMKDPNTTNIHTHGLHISGESPADDVLYVKITPGESHTCENGDGCCYMGCVSIVPANRYGAQAAAIMTS